MLKMKMEWLILVKSNVHKKSLAITQPLQLFKLTIGLSWGKEGGVGKVWEWDRPKNGATGLAFKFDRGDDVVLVPNILFEVLLEDAAPYHLFGKLVNLHDEESLVA